MSNNKQSSVDWLYDNLNKCFEKFDNGEYAYTDFVNASKEVKQQAKAMEKEQHGMTWDESMRNLDVRGGNIVRAWDDFDEHYDKMINNK